MFHDQHRVPILDVVKGFGLSIGHFSNDCHRCSFDDGRGVEKLLLNCEEPPLRSLSVENRFLAPIERQLQKLDLCPTLQSFRLQHLPAEYHDFTLV